MKKCVKEFDEWFHILSLEEKNMINDYLVFRIKDTISKAEKRIIEELKRKSVPNHNPFDKEGFYYCIARKKLNRLKVNHSKQG